jgi:hypothetical protein
MSRSLHAESWEAESSTENKETVDPLIVSLEETSEGENRLDDWRVPLGYILTINGSQIWNDLCSYSLQ